MFSKFSHIILGLILVIQIPNLLLSQTEEHVSVMDRIRIVPNAEMTTFNPGMGDVEGSLGSEEYKVSYTAVVNLVYGREKLTDISGDLWGFKVNFSLVDESDVAFYSGQVTIQSFLSKTIYIDQKRIPLDIGLAKLKIESIYTSDDDWITESDNLFDIVQNIPDDIRLELKVEASRYDYLNPSSTCTGLNLTQDGENLLVKWDHLNGAESYQIEFGFVTGYLFPGLVVTDHFQSPVRVEVPTNYFSMPMTYPPGNLYVRVRPVGRYIRDGITDPSIENFSVTGAWSEEDSVEIEFETDRNWQATTSFAEDGKFKKVIGYFDDGLKSRQSVTNISTDSTVIRASTSYDFEGRPVISVLPAPDLTSNSLAFKPNLDELEPTTFENGPLHPLPTTNGAGLYYSDSNSATMGLHTSYVPDAEGFPYTQMKYLNDPTGRVKAQSGVGAQYQLESGRETKYYYDDPSETQLRRLFGKNVGLAKYYKRNIVQDPDSQLIVSYIDIAGNTIATALAGKSPGNVQKLDSEDAGTYNITENLIDNNVIDTSSGISRVTTTIFNELPGLEYTFNYGLTGLIVGHAPELCVSCKYLLTFEILNPCGDSVYKDTILYSGADLCTDTTFAETIASFPLTFEQVGLYTITKTLKIIPLTMEEWLEILAPLLPDSTYFDSLYLAQIDTTECLKSCEEMCRDSIMAANPELDSFALEEAIKGCVFVNCLDTFYTEASGILCDAILTQMKFQLQEGGCYYNYWADTLNRLDNLTFIVEGQPVDGEDMHDVLTGDIIWEDSWLDTLALIHPDTCCYQYCLSLRESRAFDLRAQFLFTWSDIDGVDTFLLHEDPFFVTGGPGHSFHNAMRDSLLTYGSYPPPHYGSVEACGLPPESNIGIIDFIECIMPDSADIIKMETYISLYQGLKEKFIKLASPCGNPHNPACTACLEIPDEFTDIDSLDEAMDFANDSLIGLCADVCQGQATMIANMIFASCTDANWQELYDTLYNHCIMVCGWQNPMGMFLEEDLQTPSLQAVIDWLGHYSCDTLLFDSLIVVPFDSVYFPLGYPQNAGIDVVDTVCASDSINLYVLHDSLYIQSLDPAYADSLLGDQQFLLDTGIYYFVGYDPLCGQLGEPPSFAFDSANFSWFNIEATWAPGTLLGAWPELSDFEDPGCYTFGFYTPSKPGACSDYSEITIYVPGCDSIELVIDSIANCIVAAHLDYGDNTGPIDTIIWNVTIDNGSPEPYTEGDTLSNGTSYQFEVVIAFLACCDTLFLNGEVDCGCEVCTTQTIDICNERFFGLVTAEGDTLYLPSDIQATCDSNFSVANDNFVDDLQTALQAWDSCGMPEVSWEFLNDTMGCPCVRITIAGSSIIFDYIFSVPDVPVYYFDTTSCDSIAIRSIASTPSTQLISALDKDAYINLYPNPAKASFTLDFYHSYSINNFNVRIMDFSGTLVWNQNYSSFGFSDNINIQTFGIPPGFYKVVVRDDVGIYFSTIVIMRQ